MAECLFDLRGPSLSVSTLFQSLVECRKGSHTQTLKLRFLYVTDSTLKPIVGIVVTTSPIWYVLATFAEEQDE